MLKQLKNNQKDGIVFVTVLMITIVMVTVTVGIISLNVSQVTFSEQETRRIKSEMMAMGAMAYVFANQMTTTPGSSMTLSESLDGISYSINADITMDNSGPNSSNPLLIEVDY